MKKITAFFMAFMPIFIVMLLFASGLLVKNFLTIPVTSVEISKNELELELDDPTVGASEQLEAHVLPLNADNPDIYWTSSDENIVTVDRETGLVNAVNYGEAMVYAISAENQTISATCNVEIWDEDIHAIDVANADAAGYMGINQSIKLDALPIPHNRIDGDPSLEFSSTNPEIAEVTSDGVVTAKKLGQTTIEVKCHDTKFDVDPVPVHVYIGTGISSIYFENDSTIAIKDRQYNLFNDLLIYPEPSQSEKQLFQPTDFEYASSNETVATIDENGVANFIQPGDSRFTVTYKRNKNIKASKTIQSSGGIFSDISFNRYNFTGDLYDYPVNSYIPEETLYESVYPLSQDPQTGYRVTSSNEDVIKPEYDGTNHKYKYQVIGAGDAILTASILAEDGTVASEDKCVIHLTDQSDYIFLDETVEITDTTYYWLRSNVNTNVLTNKHAVLTWEYTHNDEVFTVDTTNEIVHFKKSGSVTFWLGLESFTLTCNYSTATNLDVNQQTYILEAGKRYLFNDGQTVWTPTFSDSDSFDIDSDSHSFIAKNGCFDKNVQITNGSVTKDIYVIVQERPLDIKYDHTYMPYLVTAWSKDIYMSEVINPKVVPTTATDDNGKAIKIKYSYQPRHPDTTYIWPESNAIDFNAPDIVDVTAQAGLLTEQFTIKSTCGLPSKFDLFEDYEETIPVYSGDHITLAPGDEKTFYVDANSSKFVRGFDYPSEIVENINLSALNGDKLVELSKDYDDGILGIGSWLSITIKVPENAYGHETVVIGTNGFKFLLYVDIEKKITDFNLAVNWKQLTDSEHTSITTYTNNFTADVLLNSPSLTGETYTYNLNNTGAKTVENNKIDFSAETLNVGENTLVLTAGDVSKEFTIFKKSLDNLSFTLEKETTVDHKQTLFVPAGYVSTVLTVVPDGIVETSVYDNFDLQFKNTNIVVDHQANKFAISGITAPTPEHPEFNADFTLTYNSGEPINYVLSRETITKVTFPGHDNMDKSDQKGLQQVHVFGDQSFFSPEEGLVDYYKLPIEIYDYKHKKITDLELKKQAWASLIATTNNATHVEYDDAGFLKVFFDTSDGEVYTPEEMYNDTFASSAKHNTILTVSTPSGFVSKTYEFVTVKGINSYHQDAFAYAGHKEEDFTPGIPVVLQTNFGLKDETISAKLDNDDYYMFDTIYGNGYTMNFDHFMMSAYPATSARKTRNNNIFNTNLVGCYPEHANKANSSFGCYEDDRVTDYFAYDTVSYTNRGFNLYEGYILNVRNCLFYNNTVSGLAATEKLEIDDTNAYVQDCIFFNCAIVAINLSLYAKLYLKGFIDVYNFHDSSILSNIEGLDLRFLWDIFKDDIYACNVMHTNLPDGIDRLNSFMSVPLGEGVYLWNGQTSTYDKCIDVGNQWTLPYLKQYLNVDVPYIGHLRMFSTLNNETFPTAPNYFDQFDQDGAVKWGFMAEQINKLVRIKSPITIYPY